MVGRALGKDPESVGVDCAVGCLRYLEDGERQSGGGRE
jgi:hypothetical protein